jgi:hypothetical protein
VKKIILAFCALALLMLAGCAQLGTVAPRNFNDEVAYGYATTTAMRASAANALDAKTMSTETAQKVLTVTDEVRTALDAARTMRSAGDTAGSAAKLVQVTAMLVTLQTLMTAKK